jgi:GMP synthase (glutamine-hydrolysing)
VRELKVYCELYSCLVEAEMLEEKELVGVILSGGPASVYEEGSPHVNPKVVMASSRSLSDSLPLSLSFCE